MEATGTESSSGLSPSVTSVESDELKELKDLNIQFTQLGVIIINTDGTMSKIPNWHELTDHERLKAIRLIAKRNNKRKEILLQQQAEQISEAESKVDISPTSGEILMLER